MDPELLRIMYAVMDDGGGSLVGQNTDPSTEPSVEPPVVGADPSTEPSVEPPEEPPAYTPHSYQAQAKGELKTDEFFKDYETITDVMEKFKESSVRLKELEESKPEGKVESADKYKMLDKEALGGVDFSKEDIAGLQEVAFGLGISQEAFETFAKKAAENKIAEQKFIMDRQKATENVLKTSWPTEKEFSEGWARFNAATTGLEAMGITGVKEMFKRPEFGDNAVMIQIVSEFGRFFSDDKLVDNKGFNVRNNRPGVLQYEDM